MYRTSESSVVIEPTAVNLFILNSASLCSYDMSPNFSVSVVVVFQLWLESCSLVHAIPSFETNIEKAIIEKTLASCRKVYLSLKNISAFQLPVTLPWRGISNTISSGGLLPWSQCGGLM